MTEINYAPMELLLRDPDDFARKVGMLGMAGAEQVKIVSDHDRTLTRNSSNRNENGLPTSWDVMHEALEDEELRAQDKALTAQYAHLEHRLGGLMPEMAQDWWRASLRLHQGRTNISRVRHVSFERMRYRPGLIDLLDTCDEGGIQVSIVSAGIKNVIEFGIDAATRKRAGLAEENVNEQGKYPFIVANELVLDDDGTIIGWSPADMITSRNKLEKAHEWLSIVNELRPYTILVGDSREDADVVIDPGSGEEGIVTRVRISDDEEGLSTTLTKAFVQDSWDAGYDAISRNSLTPLVKISRLIVKRSNVPRQAIPIQRQPSGHITNLRLPG